MKEALRQALSEVEATKLHTAIATVAEILGDLASPLPKLGKRCPCGYRLIPKNNDQADLHELDYSVGWQDATISRDGEELNVHSYTERNDQHTISLMCPNCQRLYRTSDADDMSWN